MAWFDDLNAQAQQQAAQGINHVYVPPTPKKKDKNLLASLLPTGGGIAGSLGGAATGAAVGSIVPGVGTAVGGILGALLGGSGGSALGKVGENAIEGNALGEGVGQEALLGGVTSLPLGAGFKLARAGLKVGAGIGKTSAGELIKQAGEKVVPQAMARAADSTAATAAGRSITQRIGSKLEDTSNKMLASQSQLTGAQARQMGIKPVDTFGSVNARTGLTNLDDMAEVGRGLTGAGDESLLDTLTRSAVGSTSGVAVGDLRSMASKLLDDKGSLISDETRKRLLNNVKNASTTMHGGSKGSLSPLADPSTALDQANAFRGTAKELTNSFTATPDQKQLAKVYNGLADHIEASIYSSPGVNESLPTLVKAGADDLLFRAQDLAATNPAQAKAYQKIADELRGVKSVADLRKMKKDFVDIGKIDNATAQVQGARSLNGADLGSKAGSVLRNPLNLLAMPLDAATPAIAGKGAELARSLQGRAAAEVAPSSGQKLFPLAVRQGGARYLTGGSDAEQPQQPMDIQSALASVPSDSSVLPQDDPSENAFGIDPSEIAQGMTRALAAGDTKAFDQLKSMYDVMSKSDNGLSATAAKSAGESADALQAVNQLEQLLNAAGGGQGKLVGGVNTLLGNAGLNADAATYNDIARGSVSQIARALGSGNVSDADAVTYAKMLPKLDDAPEVAKRKLAALRERLATARQNTLLYGTGAATGIADALNS